MTTSLVEIQGSYRERLEGFIQAESDENNCFKNQVLKRVAALAIPLISAFDCRCAVANLTDRKGAHVYSSIEMAITTLVKDILCIVPRFFNPAFQVHQSSKLFEQYGEFACYQKGKGLTTERIKIATLDDEIAHQALKVKGPKGEFIVVNVHANSGETLVDGNIVAIARLLTEYKKEGLEVIVGGDGNIPYGDPDSVEAEKQMEKLKALAEQTNCKVLIHKQGVEKERPTDPFRNAQAAYKSVKKMAESQFILLPGDFDTSPYSDRYHIVDASSETGGVKFGDPVKAFSSTLLSDHQAILVKFKGVDLVFANNTNIRDPKKGLISSKFLLGQEPTSAEGQKAKKALAPILLSLIKGLSDFFEERVPEEMCKEDSKHLSEFKGNKEKTINKVAVRQHLERLYEHEDVLPLIKKSVAYDVAKDVAGNKKVFIDKIVDNVCKEIGRKENLQYLSNLFFTELQCQGVGGFAAAPIFNSAEKWQRAQIRDLEQIPGNTGSPRLILACEDSEAPEVTTA